MTYASPSAHASAIDRRRFMQLGAGATALGSGQLDYRIERLGDDEMGELARTFKRVLENGVRIDGASYRAKEAEERDARRKAERAAKAPAPRSRKAAR